MEISCKSKDSFTAWYLEFVLALEQSEEDNH